MDESIDVDEAALLMIGGPQSLLAAPDELVTEVDRHLAMFRPLDGTLAPRDVVGLAITSAIRGQLGEGEIDARVSTAARSAVAAFVWTNRCLMARAGFLHDSDLCEPLNLDSILNSATKRFERFAEWFTATSKFIDPHDDRDRALIAAFRGILPLPARESIAATLTDAAKRIASYHRTRSGKTVIDGPDELAQQLWVTPVRKAIRLVRRANGPLEARWDALRLSKGFRRAEFGGVAPPGSSEGEHGPVSLDAGHLDPRAAPPCISGRDDETQARVVEAEERARVARAVREIRALRDDGGWLAAIEYVLGMCDMGEHLTRKQAAERHGVTVESVRYREVAVKEALARHLRGVA